MREHDYMENDNCPQWAFTDKTCCPDGTHQRGCKLLPPVDGHNKAREAKRGTKRPTIWEFLAMVTAFSFTAYLVLERVLA